MRRMVISLLVVVLGLAIIFAYRAIAPKVETVLPANGREFWVSNAIDGYTTIYIDQKTVVDLSDDDLALSFVVPPELPEYIQLLKLGNGEVIILKAALHRSGP